jgi:hypothetical protein
MRCIAAVILMLVVQPGQIKAWDIAFQFEVK